MERRVSRSRFSVARRNFSSSPSNWHHGLDLEVSTCWTRWLSSPHPLVESAVTMIIVAPFMAFAETTTADRERFAVNVSHWPWRDFHLACQLNHSQGVLGSTASRFLIREKHAGIVTSQLGIWDFRICLWSFFASTKDRGYKGFEHRETIQLHLQLQPSSTILERSISVCGLTETLLALKTSSRFLVQYLIITIKQWRYIEATLLLRRNHYAYQTFLRNMTAAVETSR